jgi:hypothetical protein
MQQFSSQAKTLDRMNIFQAFAKTSAGVSDAKHSEARQKVIL